MTIRPNPFWDYSVMLYGDQHVAGACLAIQERHGTSADVDVNILLLCTWAAAIGAGQLDNDKLTGAMATVGPWRRDVLLPLRSVRQRLDRGVESVPRELAATIRADAAKAEFEAENIEQLLLVEVVGRPAGKAMAAEVATAHAATGFARYFALLRIRPTPDDDRDLARILSVAFPASRMGNEPGGG